jgi:hypothetical protein
MSLQVWSLGSKFRACIGFQEAAHRTTEGTHWNALFLWHSRNSPESLIRCSLNPVDDTTLTSVRPVEDEPLYHHAVTLGTLNCFRTYAQTFGKGIGRSCHTLNIILLQIKRKIPKIITKISPPIIAACKSIIDSQYFFVYCDTSK